MKSVAQLYKEIYAAIFVSGQPENLAISDIPGVLAPHRQHFQEGMADIAKFSRCEQLNQVNTVEFCKTFFKCGMTVTRMPDGPISRVMAVVKTEDGLSYCDPVVYREVKWLKVECLGRAVMSSANELPAILGQLPRGFTPSTAATDNPCGRARAGIWAKHNGNIYLAPYLQSSEVIIIEWSGIKTKWEDGDPVNEALDYKQTLQLWCQYRHEHDYGQPERSAFFKVGMPAGTGGYDKALSELIWTCEEKLKVRDTTQCEPCESPVNLLGPIFTTFEESGVVEAVSDLVIAHVGNIGAGPGREGVANLVAGMDARAIVLSGNQDLTSSDYDLSVGAYYFSRLSPYYGNYGDGAEKNELWPAPGSGDWGLNSLSDWLAFFPTSGRRYYDKCIWPIHFFFFDSEEDEPDDRIENSVQGTWLRARLAMSPAPWKVVVMFGNPWASGVSGGATWPTTMRLPFKAWGADLVLSGGLPYYERLSVAGLPFIINGAGGSTIASSANSPISQSQIIKTGIYGAGKITAAADETSLTYQFQDTNGTELDSITLEK